MIPLGICWNVLEEISLWQKPTVVVASFGMNDGGYDEYLRGNVETFVSDR